MLNSYGLVLLEKMENSNPLKVERLRHKNQLADVLVKEQVRIAEFESKKAREFSEAEAEPYDSVQGQARYLSRKIAFVNGEVLTYIENAAHEIQAY